MGFAKDLPRGTLGESPSRSRDLHVSPCYAYITSAATKSYSGLLFFVCLN